MASRTPFPGCDGNARPGRSLAAPDEDAQLGEEAAEGPVDLRGDFDELLARRPRVGEVSEAVEPGRCKLSNQRLREECLLVAHPLEQRCLRDPEPGRAALNILVLARMFDRRCRGYDAIGCRIVLPASVRLRSRSVQADSNGTSPKPRRRRAIPGWPADVVLPSDPVWKRDYSGSVRRLVRDGVDVPLARLFVHAARAVPPDAEGAARARSATEEFLSRRLETLVDTKGRFVLNESLAIPFDQQGRLEVDLLCAAAGMAVELDSGQQLGDPEAFRRDRRKDQLLQENGCSVLRFLAEDVGKCLDQVLDAILRTMSGRRRSVALDGHA
jgi:very-short-patch-repair endonuclease